LKINEEIREEGKSRIYGKGQKYERLRLRLRRLAAASPLLRPELDIQPLSINFRGSICKKKNIRGFPPRPAA
jgi:hypothetical protein